VTVAIVLTALVGLVIGIWLGMPGRYSQDADDIERIMESGGARRKKVKRVFTPMAWMQRNFCANSNPSGGWCQSPGRGSGFMLHSPEESERE